MSVEAAIGPRPVPLAILLVLFVVSNVAGEIAGLLNREMMFREIPKLTTFLYGAWLAAPPIGIAGAIGLWFFRRWGLITIVISWAIVAVVDIWVGATAHAIIATGILWLIVLFSRPMRAALR
jgi:asparagine N-glycosylation enzyme membrane subunit Stt3